MKYLNTYVSVRDDDGTAHTFGPGDEIPEWALDRIDNPDVWATDVPKAHSKDEDEPLSDDYGDGPFRQRKAAQVRALAAHHGLEHNNRDVAIAALEAAGIEPGVPFGNTPVEDE